MHDAYRHALPGGAPHGVAPSKPGEPDHRSVPGGGGFPGPIQCRPFPCSVPFR
jgi:hypothetical protein